MKQVTISANPISTARALEPLEHYKHSPVIPVLMRLQQNAWLERLKAEAETARQEARAAIDAAARAKSGFLTLLSRELRTPMNGVAAVADMLRRQPLGPDAKAYVQTIMDSSETTMRILEDALDLVRAEAGELALNPKPVLLRQMMDDLQALWGPRAIQDGVSLMIGYEGDTEIAAEIDALRLRQIFNQLIGNALKYARNGVVEAFLGARAEGDRVVIDARVRDNGQGIAPERLPHLFEVAEVVYRVRRLPGAPARTGPGAHQEDQDQRQGPLVHHASSERQSRNVVLT